MGQELSIQLGSSSTKPVSVALILAAGLGTRLRPLTLERPKPLVEVVGVPLVHFALAKAHHLGVERIAMNTHHLGAQLLAELGDNYRGIPITYAAEETLLGTGGGIRNLAESLGGISTTFVVMNADALIDLDLRAMARAHATENFTATLALKDTPDKSRYGLIGTDENQRVRSFVGRTRPLGPVAWERMFCGVHLMEPDILERLPAGQESCINRVGYPPLLDEGGQVLGFDVPGYFCDVGTPERLFEANMLLLHGKTTLHGMDPFAGYTCMQDEGGERIYLAPDLQAPPDWKKRWKGPLLIGAGTTMGPDVHLGPFAVVGKGCRIAAGARISHAVLQSGAQVEAERRVAREVLGRTCTIHLNT